MPPTNKGRAIAAGGRIVFQNTIIAGDPNQLECAGQLASLGHNVIQNLVACPVAVVRTDRIGEPGLASFKASDAPGHGHYPLQRRSAAIDAADVTVCPALDQIGQPRIGSDDLCDIGAVEFTPKRR